MSIKLVIAELEKNLTRNAVQKSHVRNSFKNNRFCHRASLILDSYCLGGYTEINTFLRGKETNNSLSKYKVELMDYAFGKLKSVINIPVLYRGINSKIVEHLKVGDTFNDYAFMSSTTSLSVASAFADGGHILVINLEKQPQNVKDIRNFNRLYEEEFLINRNISLKVTKIVGKYIYLA
jgi:hypothetical protein